MTWLNFTSRHKIEHNEWFSKAMSICVYVCAVWSSASLLRLLEVHPRLDGEILPHFLLLQEGGHGVRRFRLLGWRAQAVFSGLSHSQTTYRSQYKNWRKYGLLDRQMYRPTPNNDLLPLALSNQIPFHPPPVSVPSSAAGSSAPCTRAHLPDCLPAWLSGIAWSPTQGQLHIYLDSSPVHHSTGVYSLITIFRGWYQSHRSPVTARSQREWVLGQGENPMCSRRKTYVPVKSPCSS